MSQHLAVESVEIVEAHVPRRRTGTGASETPFADHRRRVARPVKHGCQSRSPLRKRPLALQVRIVMYCVEIPVGFAQHHSLRACPALVVAPDLAVSAVETRQDAATRRRRQWACGIHVAEYYAFSGEGIDVRGLDQFLPVASEVAVTKVVEQKEYYIRTLRILFQALRGFVTVSGNGKRSEADKWDSVFHIILCSCLSP